MYQEDESPHQEKASESNEAGQVKVPSKRPCTLNDDENERNDQGDDDTSREGEIADMNIALVPIPEVFSYKEGQDEAPDEAAKPEVGVGWSQLELGLYEKGLLIFGKNRYVINPVPLLLWYWHLVCVHRGTKCVNVLSKRRDTVLNSVLLLTGRYLS